MTVSRGGQVDGVLQPETLDDACRTQVKMRAYQVGNLFIGYFFPIFVAGEGYPENTTHFNQVTVKFALNSRKIRKNLQKKNHVTTLYNVITWFS